MKHVDFHHYDQETIFTRIPTILMDNLRLFYTGDEIAAKRPTEEWNTMRADTEAIFYFLVEEGIKNGFNVESILEIPDDAGESCFSIASEFSEKICSFILDKEINLNTISTDMLVPDFRYPKLAIRMMQKGINPYVIGNTGKTRVEQFPKSFESEEAKRLMATFPKSVHYSIEDIQCTASCTVDCPSNFKKIFYKNGSLVEMSDQNRIGSGGFGMVFKQSFHGIPMAMKCLPMEKIGDERFIDDVVSDIEKKIAEIRIQMKTGGAGLIVPVAYIRQQNQEKNQDGKLIAKNYHIYIYPLYDCNLYEFHENHHDIYSEEILTNIINQCFIRLCSHKIVEIYIMKVLI